MTRPIRCALVLLSAAGMFHAAANKATAQSTPGIKVTIYPILVQAPIFGAEIDLPKLPSAPANPGGGDDGSEVNGSTGASLNSAYMAGVDVQAHRWFAEFQGFYANLGATRSSPRLDVD